ncbi:MAG: DUF4398 domain-containing protein [Pseudomonas sp.]
MMHRFLCAATLLILAGCANDPAPHEQLRLTEQAVGQAQTVAAGKQVTPLQLATDKLAHAQRVMLQEQFKDARMLAEQAELDARLAEALVLTEKSQRQLSALNADIKRLRIELGNLQ